MKSNRVFSFESLCRTGLFSVVFGLVSAGCVSHSAPSGSGGEHVTCQTSAECLNGQTCVAGSCVTSSTNPVPSTTNTTPAPTATVPTGSSSSTPPSDAPVCADKLASCTKNGDCCGFAAHQNFCVNTGGSLGSICAVACTSNSECKSGCCAPLQGGMGSVCAPAEQCGTVCATDLESCNANGDCCGYSSGHNYCVNTGGSLGAICAIACTSNSQCQSGCCAALQGGGSVCAPSTACN